MSGGFLNGRKNQPPPPPSGFDEPGDGERHRDSGLSLIHILGCTEPIALAYGAAVARQELGALPDRVVVGVSGSILKNVKSVIVPNTGHMKGIAAAAAAGIVAGDAKKELEEMCIRDRSCCVMSTESF